jgi:antitoxin component of RelBE/YafQ-DinJ toxin-antitoxin module
MNITLAIDDELVREAREVAQAMGKSLNQLVREYLEQITQRDQPARDANELRDLSREDGGRSKGWRFDRDELHERP